MASRCRLIEKAYEIPTEFRTDINRNIKEIRRKVILAKSSIREIQRYNTLSLKRQISAYLHLNFQFFFGFSIVRTDKTLFFSSSYVMKSLTWYEQI